MTTAVQDVHTIPEIAKALESLAYPVQGQDGESISTHVTINERKFPVVLTIGGPNGDELVFDVQVCQLQDAATGEIEQQVEAMAHLLAMNTELRPFAAALLDTEDGIDGTDPIVLTDSIRIGDLSVEELDAEMNAARRALNLAVATVGLKTEE